MSLTTYTGQSYFNDLLRMNTWDGLDLSKLNADVNQLVQDMWDSGSIKFLDSENRPIVYGTNDADTLDASAVTGGLIWADMPRLAPYVNNGVVLIGGKGNDVLTGGEQNDKILGGDGNELAKGGAGNDQMDGGAGVDTADYSDAPDYIYAYLGWNGGATNDVYDGTGGMDTLSNFEKLIGSAHNDAFNIQTPLTMEIDGGGGYDFLLFSDATAGMTAQLTASGVSAVIMDGKALQIKNIEAVYGGLGNDVFIR